MFKQRLFLFWLIVGVFVISACNNQFLQNSQNGLGKQSGEGNGTEINEVVITQEFTGKIIYGQQNKTEDMIYDCGERGGDFNQCGSGCEPGADICATVCVPVCNLGDGNSGKDDSTNEDSVDAGGFIGSGTDETGLGLNVPEGFRISEWVEGVDGARDLEGPDQLGNYWLSRTSKGIVSLLEVDENGDVSNVSDIFTGLNNPHGLALDPQNGLTLYIAETDKVSKVNLYTEGGPEKIADLPGGGRHYTRSLHFGPDERLYVSIGSTCDVCIENDERIAAVYVMDKNGDNFESYSTGLRNAVFMATDPVFGDIWATEMGRDNLGDDLPPDEINILADGADFGWPYCYGKQIRDSNFKAGEFTDYCSNTVGAKVNLQAHSAPLGLGFVPEEGWPENLGLDLIVAYHGSWNRSVPTGYKLMRIKLDDERNVLGREDFITGWLKDNGDKVGRPVDVLIQPGGVMYVTDDYRGSVYRVEYVG